jgi:hypothetical protein
MTLLLHIFSIVLGGLEHSKDVGNFSISHRLTCPIRSLILWTKVTVKATEHLSSLKGFYESRTTILTANRVRSLRKIRYMLGTVKNFT